MQNEHLDRLISGYVDGNDIISGLKVLKSAAGYYVGKTYHEKDGIEMEMPYSRDSEGYFKTEQEATNYLRSYIESES